MPRNAVVLVAAVVAMAAAVVTCSSSGSCGGGSSGGGSSMTGCIFVTLIVYLTTLLSKVFSFDDFFGGQGRDGTDRRTNIWTDRCFSENIILDVLAYF